MTYKAQLVVRASNKEGVEIVERVKELANGENKTFSDMALELLARGIDAGSSPNTTTKAATSAPKVAEEKKVEAPTPTPTNSGVDVDDDRAPLPAEEAGPAVDPNLPPKKIVAHYVQRREERGERAAARILVDFFAVAGPGDGGKVKKLLQQHFTEAEFEDLMQPIKATAEYTAYKERAIFGAPSRYAAN